MRAIRITTAPTAPPTMGPGLTNEAPGPNGEGLLDEDGDKVVDVIAVLDTVMEVVTVAINVHSQQEVN
jgi:hypothetical protein